MKKFLRKWVFIGMKIVGGCFFQKSQKYQIRSEIFLKNISQQHQNGWLVIPLPRENLYQKILKQPKFFGFNPEIKRDENFGNLYALYKLELGYEEEKLFSFESVVQREPQVFSGFKNDIFQKAQEINERVIKKLEYGNPIEGLYSAEEALEKKIVDCGGFATLFVAWCQKEGIPARIVAGFWAGYPTKVFSGFFARAPQNLMHAWAEFEIEKDVWIPVDPATEKLVRAGREFRSGEFGFVGSDHITFSHGSNIPIQIDKKEMRIPIFQNPFIISENKNCIHLEKKLVIDRLL